MSIPLVVAGTTYEYPVSGTNPNWGQEASQWAQAVTDTLATIAGQGDILQTQFPIENNVSIPTEVGGLLFDSAIVRGASISYSVYRTSDDNPSGHAEFGFIELILDESAPSGSKWKLTQQTNGNAGILLSIDDNGQFFYKSSDIGSANHSGLIKFLAKVLNK